MRKILIALSAAGLLCSIVSCKSEDSETQLIDKQENATSITEIKCENSFLGTPLTYTINKDSVKVVFDGNEYGGAIDGKKIRIDGDQLLVSVKPELRKAVGGSTLYVPIYTCPAVIPMGIQYFIP